jgi:DNA-binding CsgD family transcriptional regulator
MTRVESSDAAALLEEVREAARLGRYVEAAERCLGAIERAGRGELAAAAALELGRLAYVLRPTRGDTLPRVFASLAAHLEAGIADSTIPAASRARLAAVRALLAASRDPSAGLPLAREALAHAEASGDLTARVLALFALHYGLEDPDRLVERHAVSRSLVEAAVAAGDLESLVIAHWRSMIDAWTQADSAAFDYHFARFLAAADGFGDPHWSTMAAVARGARALYEGSYGEAEVEAREAMSSGLPAAVDAAAAQLGVVVVDQGRARDIEPSVMAVLAANRALYMPHRTGLAALLMSAGRFTEARAEVELTPLDALPRDASYLPALCLLADLRNHLQMGEKALDEVRERLEPYAGRNALLGDAVACFGPVDLYLGCIAVARGDREASRRHMQDGYLIAARMRGRPWLARMSRDLAQTFGDEEGGAGLAWARETLAIAEELGMKQVAAGAREILRSGETAAPPARAPETRLGKPLTPRETEVLAMLVEGKTARAIADALILSTRTVQKHIEHIHEKLGVQSRHELVVRVSRDQIAP